MTSRLNKLRAEWHSFTYAEKRTMRLGLAILAVRALIYLTCIAFLAWLTFGSRADEPLTNSAAAAVALTVVVMVSLALPRKGEDK